MKNNIYDSGTTIRSIKHIPWYSSYKKQLGRQEKNQFFNKENYLKQHSKEIANVIYNNWTKDSGLFAWCKYEDGKLNINQPHEPQATNSGLARQHLLNGYEHHIWNFYRYGKAESVQICEEIKKIINNYEGKILTELQADNKLIACNEDYPPKMDFQDCYYQYTILGEIFNEIKNRSDRKTSRKLQINHRNQRIRDNNGRDETVPFSSLSIVDLTNPDDAGIPLVIGNQQNMEEIKLRLDKLLDNHENEIYKLVNQYYIKKSELETNSNIRQFEEEREHIWYNINSEAKRIKGQCDECTKEHLDSLF